MHHAPSGTLGKQHHPFSGGFCAVHWTLLVLQRCIRAPCRKRCDVPVATWASVKAVPIIPTVPRKGSPSAPTPPTTNEFHNGSNLRPRMARSNAAS